jgi:hypothetical protein
MTAVLELVIPAINVDLGIREEGSGFENDTVLGLEHYWNEGIVHILRSD